MKHILQYSMERSGSTLITQVLKKLFPNAKVHKTHTFQRNVECPIVVAYRDFRDVMVSGWRVHKDIPLEDLDNGRIMEADEIETYLDVVVNRIRVLNKMRGTYSDNLTTLQYERFIDDYDYIFNELEVFFNTSFSDELRQDIKQYSSLETNTKRAEKFKSFHNGNWDKKTLIHGLHIYKKGQPGIWKQLVPESKHESVNSRLAKYLEQWGYEV